MTTPNLPIGTDPSALPEGVVTPAQLGSALQDTSKAKFNSLAAGRFPSIVNGTSAGDPSNVGGPLGLVVDLFANFAKNVAQADPADIQDPTDLHPLITDFFEGLPLVGTLVDLNNAINGTYAGDDDILLAIQSLFGLLRKVLEIISGVTGGAGASTTDVSAFFGNLQNLLSGGTVDPGDDPAGWFDGIAAIAASFGDLQDALDGSYVGSDAALLAIQAFVTGKWDSIADNASNVVALATGIYNGWFGSGGTGAISEVQYTIETVKDAVINGYTVETKTTSGTWTKPSGITELVVIGVGGGGTGVNGTFDGNFGSPSGETVPGGAGGLGGGYIAQQIDPASVPSTVAYTIAAADGSTTFGSFLTVNSGTSSGISTPFGYTPCESNPGAGGKGGDAIHGGSPTDGEVGESSVLAAGGAGGAAGTGSGTSGAGSAGGNASVTAVTKCGGAGGGGGGARQTTSALQTITAGGGGAGGYPGGGGGGGGGAGRGNTSSGGASGAGGPGAAGILWIYYK